MEKDVKETVEKAVEGERTGILLSNSEAEEYRSFKRGKYIAVVNENVRRVCLDLTEAKTSQELSALCALAKNHSVASVRTTPERVSVVRAALLGSPTRVDAFIGGTGKTLVKVKAYESKLCVRGGAEELTVLPNPAVLEGEKLTELKRELKKILRKAKTATVKLFIPTQEDLSKLFRFSRLAAELNVGMSVPYFLGVERLKLDEKTGCRLEVRDVNTTAEYQKMIGAGVERIQTSRLPEIYAELCMEAENLAFAVPVAKIQTVRRVEPLTEKKNVRGEAEEKQPQKATNGATIEETGKGSSLPLQPSLREKNLRTAEAYRALLEEKDEKLKERGE